MDKMSAFASLKPGQQGIVAAENRPLAVLGGAPAFAEKLLVGRPNLGDRARFLARINDLLDRRWLTNDGPVVQ